MGGGGRNEKRGMAEQTELRWVAMSKATRNLADALLLFPDANMLHCGAELSDGDVRRELWFVTAPIKDLLR